MYVISDSENVFYIDPPKFVIVVKTDNVGWSDDDQFRFMGWGVYDIDWGDGTIEYGVEDFQTHTYPAAGVYTIRVAGLSAYGLGYFVPNSWTPNPEVEESRKIIEMKEWGLTPIQIQHPFSYITEDMRFTALDRPSLYGNITGLFRGATALPDVKWWDMTNVEIFTAVFRDVGNLSADVSLWQFDNAKSLAQMFRVSAMNPDVSGWNIGTVESLHTMFFGAASANPDVSNWDTSNVETLYATFGSSGADPDVSNWVTSKVKNLERTFQSITGNPNVSNWDTGNVENMSFTFFGASNANPDLSKWSLASVTTMTQMLRDSGISVENYSRWLIRCANWVHTYGQPLSIPLGAQSRHYNNTEYEPTLEYKNAVDARLYLTSTIESGGAGWSITDEGEEI